MEDSQEVVEELVEILEYLGGAGIAYILPRPTNSPADPGARNS